MGLLCSDREVGFTDNLGTAEKLNVCFSVDFIKEYKIGGHRQDG